MNKLVLSLALVLSFITALRVRDWHDETRLWAAAVQEAPMKPRGWVNFGRATQIAGDDAGAIEAYHKAIALSFDDRRVPGSNVYARLAAETDIATVLIHKGNVQGAWNQLDTVLRDTHWTMFPYAVFHRGVLEAITNQCAKAAADWDQAVRYDGTLSRPPMPVNCQLQGFK